MRRLMRLALAAAPSAILSMPAAAAAQNSDSDQIQATLTVIQALLVTGTQDLAFGTVLGGATVIIDWQDPLAGAMEIDAAPGEQIDVAFTALPAVLTLVGGTETVAITYTAGVNDVNDPSSGTEVPDPTGLGVASFPVPGTGQVYIWIGGSVSPSASQAVGDYEATIELTASYTGT